MDGGAARSCRSRGGARWTLHLRGARGGVLPRVGAGRLRDGERALLGEPGHGLDPYAVALGSVSVVRDVGGWRLEALSLLP